MSVDFHAQRELSLIVDDGFDPVAYWRDKPFKKWGVVVGQWKESRFVGRTVYVSASTLERAEATALANVAGSKRLEARARLATPRDLGCVRIETAIRTPYAYEVTNAFGELQLIYAERATDDDLAQPYVSLFKA